MCVPYAVHQIVIDVWDYSTDDKKLTFRDPPGLLTGINKCEPFDCPGPDDAWLSGNITGNSTPNPISFAGAVVKRFGVNFGGTTAAVDNLGLPGASPAPNGIWIPDLAAPCDQYLVRASVTILDHGALLNANAHGNKNTGDWEYGDCIGKGYFISDVQPQVPLTSLLFGIGTPGAANWVPGCWGADNKPGNSKTGAVLIENPYAGQDVPFTLDEEFELRNLWGTYFKSRLEWIWTALDSDPANVSGYTQRLKTTTVSWTAEVRGDGNATAHATMKDAAGADLGWSAAKVDLNTASPDAIYEALRDGRAWADGDELKQLVANIVAFRRRELAGGPALVSVDGTNYVGAFRHPFFTEATCTEPVKDESDPDNIKRTYNVTLQIYNPWPGDFDGDIAGVLGDGKLRTGPYRITFDVNAPHQVTPAAKRQFGGASPGLGLGTMSQGQVKEVTDYQVICHNSKTLKEVVKSIRLHWGDLKYRGKVLNVDLITGGGGGSNVATMESAGRISRTASFDNITRGSRNNAPICRIYVTDWKPPGQNPGTPIAVSLPNCITDGATALPVRAPAGSDYKAFPRVGDLNQVLRFQPAKDTWWAEPWIVTVSKTSRANESNVKFDWMKDIGNLDFAAGTAAAYAANILCVGGPWNDGLDNDSDGKTDFDDTGKPDAGQPGGPECRVAGKINLNTAAPDTLQQLASGVGTSGLSGIAASRPLKSPAEVIASAATPSGIEARDEHFTRISNIATVRSDVFSVYGTVQIIDPTSNVNKVIPDTGIVRSRRFWALVDRSPSLAYPPTNKDNFIYPRILNFQWLD